jgi:hypothetical protein
MVENIEPDVFYLWDEKTSSLVAVTDSTWQEYNRLMDQVRSGLGALPIYSLNAQVQGLVRDDLAEVEVRLEIGIDRAHSQAIRIPLRLHPAILRESCYEGLGMAAVSFDRASNSYVCWLKALPNSRHVLTLNMVLPLHRSGDQTQLELQLPDALTQIDLVLPLERPEVSLEGEQFRLLPPQALAGGQSRVEVIAFSGDLKMRWRSAASAQAPPRPSLTVASQVTLSVADPSYIRVDANLDVRAERGEFSVFHVRLPPGMTLVTRETAGYSLQVVETPAGSTTLGPLVRVELAARERATSIQLYGEISRTASANAPLEVVGFLVPEAYYQRSDVLLSVDGEWSVRTVQSQNVRRVGNLSDAERQSGVVAKFVYFANRTQPSSLQLQVQPQEALITIEPTYVLRFMDQRARFDAVLRFHVRGAAAKGFAMWMGDWVPREIRPPELLDLTAGGPPAEDRQILPVPFAVDRLPASGDFEIRLSAERLVGSLGEEPLSILLPRPQSLARAQDQMLSVIPPNLIVVAHESLDFAPVLSAMPEFTATSVDFTTTLPGDLRDELVKSRPMFFQTAATSEPLRFVALVRPRPQSVSVLSTLNLRLETNRAEVSQTLQLQVAHQPMQNIVLEAPALMARSGVALYFDGQPLATNVAPVAGNSDRVRLLATLPVPRVGEIPLQLAYQMAIPELIQEQRHPIALPAAIPVHDHPFAKAETRLMVDRLPGNWQCSVTDAGWQSWDPPEVDPGELGAAFRTSSLAATVPIEVSTAVRAEGPTVIRRAWYQTNMTGATRVDRAVFRVFTARDRLQIELPPEARRSPADVTVAVDGEQVVDLDVSSDGIVSLDLGTPSGSREYVVEIWYGFSQAAARRLSGKTDVARIRGAAGLHLTYWQLVLPHNVHLLWEPAGLTPEYQWEWQSWRWNRQCHREQSDLERWVGAVKADTFPSASNQYLFSTYGSQASLSLRTASRSLLVLLASGGVLAVGMALLYLRRLRHPALLLLLAVVTLGLAVVHPGLGLLLCQAATVGIVLVIVGRVVDRLIPQRDVAQISRSTYLTTESRSHSVVSVPSVGTTASAAAPVEVSSGEIDL